ncbi:MAG: tetratricopeptide repeat protein, partial [Chitinophagaceae bacterium]
MRKLFLTAAFAASLTITYAQDLKDVQEKISKGKYDEAKEKLDKFLADPKNANNANAYYYKGQIHGYYAQTDSAGKLTYDATKEAFNAYKKALEIDPKNPLMAIDQNIGLFQLFDMNYNRGIKQYNDKNYDAAFANFEKAIELQDFIKNKKFTLPSYTPPALDTQLLNLTASAAYLAKKEDVAIGYFSRLADAKIATPEFKEIYALVAQHYLKKNDDANASKYINIGKELYKDEDYWLSLEFGNVGNDRDAKLKRYEELLVKYPNNATLALDYAIEQFNHTYVWDKKPADYTDRQAKLQTALDKALALNPTNDTTRIDLAAVYIEGTGETMKGIEQLLTIVRQDSTNIPANIILGKMAVESGQLDKAVLRGETILRVDQDNVEARLFLAEALKRKGETAKAKQLFTEAKKIMKNPAFSKDMDEYMATFKY